MTMRNFFSLICCSLRMSLDLN